ncbi:MAG: PH domain-containing protein [Bacillota bacterium]|nr:PH domain-containing protein [Bacillota bacterium]
MESFKLAPLDRTARVVSPLVTVGVLVGSLGFAWVLAFLFSPREYRVSEGEIRIRTPVSSHPIPIRNIERIGIREKMAPGVGLTWVAGLFGYASLFSLSDGSAAKVYASSWERMVEINLANGERYLLSPADPDRFVKSVTALMSGS